jgi:ATP-dependent DNA helicase RecG
MTRPRHPVPFSGSASPRNELPRTSKEHFEPARLDEPLTVLPGVGPALARAAAKLGIGTIRDLLFHFPFRHEDYTCHRRIGELKWDEEATVSCRLESISRRPTRRRNLRLVVASVSDDSGYMEAIWFNQDYLADQLSPGDRLLLRGRYDGAGRCFTVKGHELLGRQGAGLHTTGLVPVYETTAKISVKRLRGWLGRCITLAGLLADPLPSAVRHRLGLPLKGDAVTAMHFPRMRGEFGLARRRLAFEELYLMQLGLLSHRKAFGRERRGVRLEPGGGLTDRFISGLPFRLTNDQRDACRQVSEDMAAERPMQRLLQGDVGSGKTVVAVFTLLRAVENGRQAALMAPTEVLAEQHFLNIRRMLAGLGVETDLLSSRNKPKERRLMLERIAAGRVSLVVGTHALIQEDVDFPGLGVVVVDEQHRFGVNQRELLAEKATHSGVTPHVLHMTATPIPRTLALTLYGDLDVSVIRTMPPGRRETVTRLVPESKRALAYGFIREQLEKGRQCYVVCPLIEESEAVEARAVSAEAERLAEGEFRSYRLGILHGQMPAEEKQQAMAAFSSGETQVLVTTTVIEVGVDVPNATVMMVEEADRFGLAQLHQLRGRVGRGRHKSYCLLFGEGGTEQARRRLAAMEATSDGFHLADMDLEIRGEGQLFGLRQSGLPDLRLARLVRDQELLGQARELAAEMIDSDPRLARPENALLRDEVQRVFGDSVRWLRKV